MKKKNTFWISSAPRTGSMWLFNITREILKESGYEVYPKIIPQYDKKMLDIYYKEALPDQNDLNKYVFKVHTILKPDTPRSKILTTIRDPRDICISFKEFMKTDFKSSLKATKSILNFTKIYKNFEKDYLIILKYENIGKKPIDTIIKIGKFINCKVEYNLAEKISKKFSKDNVKNIIKENDNNINLKIKENKEVSKSEIVYFSKDNYRSFDINTGFQTGHVSKRNSGDWKKALSSEEIEIINSQFKDFLIENNYD